MSRSFLGVDLRAGPLDTESASASFDTALPDDRRRLPARPTYMTNVVWSAGAEVADN
jgi:hypothetical protein